MSTKPKARILCVDDDPQVLAGLGLHLRRHYVIETATSTEGAFDLLAREPNIAVVVSDMHMPGMDGATFLAKVRQLAPDTVRVLLTGHLDVEIAIAAVNEGQVFRFLTKPCAPPRLLAAIEAAVDQHNLLTAERVLLEQTLHGAIKILTDMLALVSPASFARAMRVKKLVTDLADKLAIRERWQVEVAAMLSQVGYITVPPELAERVYYGKQLLPEEQALIARMPALTEELLGNIPRMEPVREILKGSAKPFRPEGASAPATSVEPKAAAIARDAQLLRIAFDFDTLESTESTSPDAALEIMRGRTGIYNPEILQALAELRGAEHVTEVVREVPVSGLQVGMVVAEDVKLATGVLLVARGYEITERLLERVRNFPEAMRKEPWLVIVRMQG